MNDQENRNSWMGKKGFDEAYYYEDAKSDLGPGHSDDTIRERVKEILFRNDYSSENIQIKVCDGVVTVQGPIRLARDIAQVIQKLSGIKEVQVLQEDMN
jgi:osmotically-inducible protein OsmY